MVKKAYKRLGFVTRMCRDFNNIKCIRTLYYALVRNLLESARKFGRLNSHATQLLLKECKRNSVAFCFTNLDINQKNMPID